MPLKVLVVDLGSQWTHRIWRTLRDLNCESEIIPSNTPLSKIKDADALVFSGGACRIGKGELSAAGNCDLFLDKFTGGILGVCSGQQVIALHYGGKVAPAVKPEYGPVEIHVVGEDDLFRGFPRKFKAWASHNDEVKNAPGFKLLASSADCKWHAFKHERKPVYGTLFHPEVQHTEHGDEIYANFLKALKK
ncbi:MAG: GMP synthase subunit A [Candidatus Norongarragalinales archaeon]